MNYASSAIKNTYVPRRTTNPISQTAFRRNSLPGYSLLNKQMTKRRNSYSAGEQINRQTNPISVLSASVMLPPNQPSYDLRSTSLSDCPVSSPTSHSSADITGISNVRVECCMSADGQSASSFYSDTFLRTAIDHGESTLLQTTTSPSTATSQPRSTESCLKTLPEIFMLPPYKPSLTPPSYFNGWTAPPINKHDITTTPLSLSTSKSSSTSSANSCNQSNTTHSTPSLFHRMRLSSKETSFFALPSQTENTQNSRISSFPSLSSLFQTSQPHGSLRSLRQGNTTSLDVNPPWSKGRSFFASSKGVGLLGSGCKDYDKKAVGDLLSDIVSLDDASTTRSAANIVRFMDRLCSYSIPSPSTSPIACSSRCHYKLLKGDMLEKLYNSLKKRNWPADIINIFAYSKEVMSSLEIPLIPKQTSGFRLQTGARMKPHPMKEESGGEDYFFISDVAGAIGVADGVSEWKSFGVNPRLFAEQLMESCKEVANSSICSGWSLHHNRAQSILREGFAKVSVYGGSTATVACLDEAGSSLEVSNLGDSTLVVLRRNRTCGTMTCVFRTVELQHTFNMPYQLIRLPQLNDIQTLRSQGLPELAKVTLRMRLGGCRPLDTPDDATTYRVPLMEGDLVLVGTDGLFDNLYEDEICELTTLAVSPSEAVAAGKAEMSTDPKALADALVELAAYRSRDKTAIIPFLVNAQKAGLIGDPADRAGGKLDDIALVVCWVVPTNMARTPKTDGPETTYGGKEDGGRLVNH